jgi:histidinol-phosphate aminotransferase
MPSIVLDRNENQYGPAPSCYEVLQTANLEQLSLYSRDFALGRKSELTEVLGKAVGIPENRVLLSYGSEDMLKQVVHCYLHRGETLMLPRQSWWYYKSIASEVNGTAFEYTLHEKGNRFAYDIEEMMRLYDTHSPQLILIASPNNPTGNSIPADDLTALIRHCTASVIVLDEAYFGFTSTASDHLRMLLSSHGRLVVLRTFSKYYALAGLRIGYAFVGEELTELITFSARYLGYNQLTERIALAALNEHEYYESITRQMRGDKESYYTAIDAMEGFTAFRSDANFILVRYPVALRQHLQTGLKQRGIVLKFLNDPGLEDCVRITIGTREQNELVIASLQELVDAKATPARAPSLRAQ